MSKRWEKFITIVLCIAVSCGVSLAQGLPATILEVDLENRVQYADDISDVSRLGTDPNVTTVIPTRNFRKSAGVGDIVAVNGQPAKGTFIMNVRQLNLRPEPNPGEAIADITRTAILEFRFEILKPDGTAIGTIVAAGFGAGPAPPGAPLATMERRSEAERRSA